MRAGTNSRRTFRPGFSLVEVGIAVLLLAVVMIPILTLSEGGSRNIRTTTEALAAHAAALELLEQVLIIPCRSLPVGAWDDARLRDGAAMAPGHAWRFHLSPVPDLRRRLEISDLSKDGRVRFRKIAVEVEWQAGPGGPPAPGAGPAARKVRLSGLVALDGD